MPVQRNSSYSTECGGPRSAEPPASLRQRWLFEAGAALLLASAPLLATPCRPVPDPQGTLAGAQGLYAEGHFEAAAAAYAGSAQRTDGKARLDAMAGWASALKAMACEADAIAVHRERLKLADSLGDTEARRLSWARLGRLTSPTDSAEAERLARLALEGAERSTQPDDIASDAHTTLAILAVPRSEHTGAQSELASALATATSALRRSEAWRTLGRLRDADASFGSPAEAYQRSLDAARESGEIEATALAQLGLAGALARTDPQAAAALRDEARAQARRHAMRRVEAFADQLEAQALRGSARYVDRLAAHELLGRAQARYEEIGDAAQERAVLLELAVNRHSRGDQAGALSALERSGRLSLGLGYLAEAAKAEHLSALLLLESEPPDLDEAERRLRGVLDAMQRLPAVAEHARVLHNLAMVELGRGDTSAALRDFVQAQQLVADSREAEAAELRELLWLSIGSALLKAGEVDPAAALLRRATRAGSAEVRGRAWWILAQLSEPSAPQAALVYYRRALRDIDPLRPRGPDLPQTARSAFERRYSSLYRELAALLLRLQQPIAAHYVASLMQQMELLEASWAPQRGERDGLPALGMAGAQAECESALAEREGSYAQLWLDRAALMTPVLSACCIDAAGCTEPAERARPYCERDRKVETTRTVLAREEAECVASLQTRAQETAFFVKPAFVDDWRKAVGNGATLVVTLLQQDRLHVLVRSPATAGYIVRTRPVGRHQVEELVTRWRMARLEAAGQRDKLGAEALHARQVRQAAQLRAGLLREMYDLLFADIPATLLTPQADLRRSFLVMALDGPLRELPVAALFDGERYLGERAGIALLTPRTLAARETRGAARDRALVLGLANAATPPLPYVQSEVTEIARLLGVQGHLDQAASKARLMGWLRGLDGPALALHVATHGNIGETPASTRIDLWGDALTGFQLEELREQLAQVRLVVLSSCESAGPGAGVLALGLAGLVEQGTRSVVGSLWKADDRATRAFMVDFYTDWIGAGLASVSQSIAAAQRRAREVDPHPYYWAAFVVIGRWD